MKLIAKLTAFSLGLACAVSTALAAEVAMPDGATLAAALADQELTSKNSIYIVRMAESPVVAYEGTIKGYRATKPKKNQKINPNSPAVRAYSDYLTQRHDAVLNKVGGGKKLYSYKYAVNGFAAKLNKNQLNALRKQPGVISVTPDRIMQPDTVSTSAMLDLEAGVWSELGGTGNAGEGIIVGIIDSGVWPENPSFSDRTGSNKKGKAGKLDFQQIPGWHGKCTPGEAFPASDCNQKLIGAQWFNAGFGGDENVKALFPYEYKSARDADGHGTHTASTAAGNNGVEVVINGAQVGSASGMAPRARVSVYKVCWGRGGEGGCASSDSVAAIDQAVADGVDVLNFSISGSTSSFLDPVEVAFLFAADAGIFVAASAGNSGPGASTVAHNSPWLTTVAAGTHDRAYEATVTTGSGDVVDGVSLGDGASGDLVYSADVVAVGADITEGTLCYPGALDADKVSGKIVLCDRGVIARVDKSLAVSQAGGIGMILANVSPSSLNADFHIVPSVHVDHLVGPSLRAYAQTVGATAILSPGTQVVGEASEVAAFSSRGPALAGAGDMLKPDIMAPGVDIIAAVSPDGYNGNNFDALSGTSMSSPHMAGLGALMKQLQPDWSPMAIKSAFMTTTTQQTNQGNDIAGGAFAYGAGFVVPNTAANPGLVYDAGFNDWLGFLCGTGELAAGYCPAIGFDPSDLNYPSIAIGALVGEQTVTRSVTNVGNTATYYATVEGLDGIDVTVTPDSLSLAPGETASYTVTLATTPSAVLEVYAHGAVSWNDGEHTVRSPIVARPTQFSAPAEVAGTGDSGSINFDIGFGYEGDYSAILNGLVAATTAAGTVDDDPADDINTALLSGVGISVHLVPATPGAPLQRFALFDDYTDGDDDLDLYVFDATGAFLGGSGSVASAEQVDIVNPTSAGYVVVVHAYETDGADANYTLFSWAPAGDAGNATVTAPAQATPGADSITVDWSGLATQKYLGVISHQDASSELGQTVINIQNDG